ncbi:MAG: DNA ligase [Motiliproteus sp.]
MNLSPLSATALITALCHSHTINAATMSEPTAQQPIGPNNTTSQKKLSPELMLAKRYHSDIELQHYLVSEKFDGVRAYWDGRQLLSRQGYPIRAPLWFTQALPATPLDTELWIGRGKFEPLSAAVRRYQPIDQEWRLIQLQLLDLPTSSEPFKIRIGQLKQLAAQIDHRQIKALDYHRVTTESELLALLEQQVSNGAEGLMLNRIDAPYQAGRSDAIVKYKPYLDAEAVVLAHLPGKGKFEGMMGSILVQIDNGQIFRIGSGFSHQQRRQPPPIGSLISFQYHGLTQSGIPRFASYLRPYQVAGQPPSDNTDPQSLSD